MTKNMKDRYLYRAKRTDNGKWIIGILIIFEGIAYIMEDENTYIRAYYDGGDCVDFDMRAYKVDPSAICQCTGLRDKNGKLIWENDIVSDECGNMAEIIWNDAELQYLVDYEFEPMTLGEWCLVVGNIFDNPELLEVGE